MVSVSVQTVLELMDTTEVTVLPAPVLTAGVSPLDAGVIEVQEGSAEGAGAVSWSWVATDAEGGVVGEEVGSGPTFVPGESGYWGVTGTNVYGCSAFSPAGLFCLPGDGAEWIYGVETNELVTDPPGLATWYVEDAEGGWVELGTTEGGWYPEENGWYAAEVVTVGTCTAWTGPIAVCQPEAPLEVVPSGPPGGVLLTVVSELPAGYETISWWANGTLLGTGAAEAWGDWVATVSGWHTAVATDQVGCNLVSDSVLVCLPFPPFVLEFDPEVPSVSAPEGAVGYVWTLDGDVLAETGPVLTDPGLGVVSVEAIPFVGCPGTQASIEMGVSGAGEGGAPWSVFPNPFRDQLIVKGPFQAGFRAQLLTAEGRITTDLPIPSGGGQPTWVTLTPEDGGSAGWYVVRILDATGNPMARIPLLRLGTQH